MRLHKLKFSPERFGLKNLIMTIYEKFPYFEREELPRLLMCFCGTSLVFVGFKKKCYSSWHLKYMFSFSTSSSDILICCPSSLKSERTNTHTVWSHYFVSLLYSHIWKIWLFNTVFNRFSPHKETQTLFSLLSVLVYDHLNKVDSV